MSATIKTEIIEPICEVSVKEEPLCQKGGACFPSIEPYKQPPTKLGTNTLPPKKKKKLAGMKGRQLWHHLSTDVIKFCQENGIVASSATCSCRMPMALSENGVWKCRVGDEHTIPLRKGTWFEESELTLQEILWIAYMWVHEYSYSSMLHESSNSPETLVEWCTCCQDACRAILESKSDPLGNLVEIFECKILGKKAKNNSSWVFFGVEQFSTKTVLAVVKDKKSKTIVELFEKHVLPETTVFGNAWNAYAQLDEEDFEYLTKERSVTFYDTAHQVELSTFDDLVQASGRPPLGTNGYLKYEFTAHFCEYIYRKSLNFATDAYLTFLRDIGRVYTPCNTMDEASSILPD